MTTLSVIGDTVGERDGLPVVGLAVVGLLVVGLAVGEAVGSIPSTHMHTSCSGLSHDSSPSAYSQFTKVLVVTAEPKVLVGESVVKSLQFVDTDVPVYEHPQIALSVELPLDDVTLAVLRLFTRFPLVSMVQLGAISMPVGPVIMSDSLKS
jgi:hypothetical protein